MSLQDIITFPEIKKTLSEYVDFIHDHSQHPELDEENVMKCLGELEGCTVSEHELKETQMGHIITKLTHQERSTKISEKAKEIQLKWMDMVVEEKEKDNSKLKRKNNHNGDNHTDTKRVAVESEDGVPNHTSPSRASKNKLSESTELPDIKDCKFQGTLSQFIHRNTNQIRLFQALSVKHGKEESKRLTRHQEAEAVKLIQEIAIDLEKKLYEEYGQDDHEYAHHFRSLFTNLKDPLNFELRMSVLSKNISVEDLIKKSYEELANPEVKELRNDQNKAKEDVAVLHEISPGVINSGDQGVFLGGNNRCSSCNSEKVYYIPDSATNQSDSLLVSCSNCGHHWKLGD